jgi:hypothetical protein
MQTYQIPATVGKATVMTPRKSMKTLSGQPTSVLKSEPGPTEYGSRSPNYRAETARFWRIWTLKMNTIMPRAWAYVLQHVINTIYASKLRWISLSPYHIPFTWYTNFSVCVHKRLVLTTFQRFITTQILKSTMNGARDDPPQVHTTAISVLAVT